MDEKILDLLHEIHRMLSDHLQTGFVKDRARDDLPMMSTLFDYYRQFDLDDIAELMPRIYPDASGTEWSRCFTQTTRRG